MQVKYFLSLHLNGNTAACKSLRPSTSTAACTQHCTTQNSWTIWSLIMIVKYAFYVPWIDSSHANGDQFNNLQFYVESNSTVISFIPLLFQLSSRWPTTWCSTSMVARKGNAVYDFYQFRHRWYSIQTLKLKFCVSVSVQFFVRHCTKRYCQTYASVPERSGQLTIYIGCGILLPQTGVIRSSLLFIGQLFICGANL